MCTKKLCALHTDAQRKEIREQLLEERIDEKREIEDTNSSSSPITIADLNDNSTSDAEYGNSNNTSQSNDNVNEY